MISVKVKAKKLDNLQPTSLFIKANIRAHIQLFYLQDRLALSAEQSYCLQGSYTAYTFITVLLDIWH